ncbi:MULTISPECIES: IclR family transcriptional regulator [unclassified Pseudomonas]|uniref:IclR family transcriptional regulator n=1 Tax=unclassified Pseudomonas TaxID=196821 RepID=UPI000BC8B538|nr:MULTISPECIES: helix-turn-helix domain-containing protein [unclassified Pseudomonas]PVZ20522.1 IclR family transcriptional regulator [Pseudomonas sp. URIL14HWK12:I12]PVZ27588.1 IclR family transcriptional regulator [Pseudomonas sp. URIL14HWK12:I10]PVZ38477.1 IclR family transcriptional regulator [Pseudomonas sp. URIL14HWK12:I11]SNZ03201.1 transcriptional regulator, IclR family [Pseudomonas sp. URIL14HWK12:I9]
MVKIKPRPAVSGVASADRVLTVLSAFRIGDTALSLVDLTERTGLIKSTIMRLVVSLETAGFVNRLADGRYMLASEVMRLNAVYQESLDLERHVLPLLHRLTDETGETASFYVRHGAYRLCQYRVNSPHRLRLHLQPGDIRPMDGAASAQALRCTYERALEHPAPFYSCGATDPHSASMSLPIFGALNELVGALVVSGPAGRLTEERASSFNELFMQIARDLARSLGGKAEAGQNP